MNIIAKPTDVDIFLLTRFAKPKFSFLKDNGLVAIIEKSIDLFEFRVDEIKINRNSLSGQFINFSKFIGSCFFNCSMGIEEASIGIRNPNNDIIGQLINSFYNLMPDDEYSNVRININVHAISESKIDEYLNSLVPAYPLGLQDNLIGHGGIYFLKDASNNMDYHITMAPSLLFENAIYTTVQFIISPCKHNLIDFSAFIIKKYKDINFCFGIQFEE